MTITFLWHGSLTSATHDGKLWQHPDPGLESLLNTIPGDPESVARRLCGVVVQEVPSEPDEDTSDA